MISSNTCGSSLERASNIKSVPLVRGAISGGATICANTAGTYSDVAIAGATSYTWTVPSGMSTTSNVTLRSITVLTSANWSGGSISVKANNACGSSVARSLALKTSVTQPGVISGGITACPSDTKLFSVTYSPGMNYSWSAANGAVITSTGNNASVVFASFPETLTVFAQAGCGFSTPRSLIVNRATAPAIPSVITGVTKACPGDILSYGVTPVSGLTYNWFSPSGANITNGQSTSTATLEYTNTFTAISPVSVTANNGCGSSSPRVLNVSVNTPVIPGAIAGNNYGICGGSDQSFSVAAVSGITYNWAFSVTGSSISNLSGSGNSVNVTFPTSFTSTYATLSVTGTNGCGTSLARKLTIYRTPSTPVFISTLSLLPCVGQAPIGYAINAVKGATSYTWSSISGTAVSITQTSDTTANVVFNSNGTRNITAKVSSACSYVNKSISVVVGTGCRDGEDFSNNTDEPISVYPNPATDRITVSFNGEQSSIYHITLEDMMGREVMIQNGTTEIGISNLELNLSGISKGLYLIHITKGNSNKAMRLLIE